MSTAITLYTKTNPVLIGLLLSGDDTQKSLSDKATRLGLVLATMEGQSGFRPLRRALERAPRRVLTSRVVGTTGITISQALSYYLGQTFKPSLPRQREHAVALREVSSHGSSKTKASCKRVVRSIMKQS